MRTRTNENGFQIECAQQKTVLLRWLFQSQFILFNEWNCAPKSRWKIITHIGNRWNDSKIHFKCVHFAPELNAKMHFVRFVECKTIFDAVNCVRLAIQCSNTASNWQISNASKIEWLKWPQNDCTRESRDSLFQIVNYFEQVILAGGDDRLHRCDRKIYFRN